MKLIELSAEAYRTAFPSVLTPYGSVSFNLLNASKTGELQFLAMVDNSGKYRLGMIFGSSEEELLCPFSAPFGEISFNSPQKIETVNEFFRLIVSAYTGKRIVVTLPPAFYAPDMQPKFVGCLSAAASSSWCDFNYHYDLSRFPEFSSCLDANARNHFNRAVKAGLDFAECSIDEAYAVIKRNRDEKGYPLRMTIDALRQTAEIVPIDAFLMSLDRCPVAAAIVYRLNDRIAQVIYWGHIGEYSNLRPMNLLAREVFARYHKDGFKIVDIGPSSSNGIPDLGLCTFKEAIGCILSFKPTFIIGC